ncbi:MAG: hypothetical protein M3O82_09750 [Verrucomicrobiota bacterium]|nr:hypothetical protein [Verrucomicrobiota bacterium]
MPEKKIPRELSRFSYLAAATASSEPAPAVVEIIFRRTFCKICTPGVSLEVDAKSLAFTDADLLVLEKVTID